MVGSTRFGLLASSLVLCAALTHTGAQANVQTVSGSISGDLSDGADVSLTVTYQATNGVLLPGLGLRVHFDSTTLTVGDADVLRASNIGLQLHHDAMNYDDSLLTDKYFLLAWADTQGQWPPESQPSVLVTLPITANSGFEDSTVKFTAASLSAGYTFEGADVVISEESDSIVPPTTIPTPSSGGGGGCTVGTAGNGDSSLPLILLAMGLVFVRRAMVPAVTTNRHEHNEWLVSDD